LIIKKVDALNPTKTLSGAEFKLYSDVALTVQVGAAVTTGTDGIARFEDLEPGTYWLKETKAPKDYDLLAVALEVTVVASATDPEALVITNQYNPPEDIQTGMMDWNVLILGGLALLAGMLLVLFTRKRRVTAAK
jgi:LPXTG-motif cell wall-anchored protein